MQRAPGEYASGFTLGVSGRKDRIFSHYFTSVDVPLTPSFDLSFANDRTLDARGVPLGLRPLGSHCWLSPARVGHAAALELPD